MTDASLPSWPAPPTPDPGPLPPPVTAVAYRPHAGFVHVAIVMAVVVALIDVIEIPSAILVDRTVVLQDGEEAVTSMTPLLVYGAISVLGVIALVGAYVSNCLWLWRARSNAEVLAPAVQTRGRGWVWGGWICPVVALWFPYQVVRDVGATHDHGSRRRPVVGWWWAAFLAMVIVERVTSAAYTASDSMRVPVVSEALEAGFTVVALVLWILVVRVTVRDQDAEARARQLA